mgnify:CR=1 FL=1
MASVFSGRYYSQLRWSKEGDSKVQVLDDITQQIQRYLLVQIFTSAIVGVATGLAFWAIGLENAGEVAYQQGDYAAAHALQLVRVAEQRRGWVLFV